MKQAHSRESGNERAPFKARERHLKGWGVDLNDRPGVPKELNDENGSSGPKSHWAKHTQQPETVKLLRTIERPGVSGTFCAPRGP